MSQYFAVAAATVCRVLIIAFAGVVVGTQFRGQESTVRAIGKIIVTIFLPCMLFSKLVDNLTYDVMAECYSAVIFSAISSTFGYLCGKIILRCVSEQTLSRVGSEAFLLGCLTLNATTFPLGMLMTMQDVAWLNVELAIIFVFVFNINSGLMLWGVGMTMVRSGAKRLKNKQQQQGVHLVSAETTASTSSAVTKSDDHVQLQNGCNDNEDGAYVKPPLPESSSASNASPTTQHQSCNAEGDDDTTTVTGLRGLYRKYIAPSLNPPIIATLLALCICAVPPLQRVIKIVPPMSIVLDGIRTVGQGCVPMTLLGLGCNLLSSGEHATQKQQQPTATTSTSPAALAPITTTTGSDHVKDDDDGKAPFSFIAAIATVKLVITPALLFALVVGLTAVGIPLSRNLRFVVLLESCAPTAINGAIICTLHNFHAKAYSTMVIAVHGIAVVTSPLWIALFLWYLS